MSVIKVKAERTRDGKPLPFTYVLPEDIFDAYSEGRKLNEHGYGWGETENRAGETASHCSTGVLIPYCRAQKLKPKANGTWELVDWAVDATHRSNCSSFTSNAFAVALAHAQIDKGGTKYWLALVGEVPLPVNFYQYFQLANKNLANWNRGSAQALRAFNVGEGVFGNRLLRGDALQIQWDGSNLEAGHSVFCFHARRVSATQTRFLYISCQTGTNGLGVPLNDWSLEALLTAAGAKKEKVRGPTKKDSGKKDAAGKVIYETVYADKDKWVEHAESFAKDGFDTPSYIQRVLTHGEWYVTDESDDANGGAGKTKKGFYRVHVSRPHRPFPCFPVSLKGARTFCYFRTKDPTVAPPDGHTSVDPKALAETYYRNNEEGPGGWYPMGLGRTWHGGVHLSPPDGSLVHAAFDGRVVCARLAPEDSQLWTDKKWQAGTSPNFLLLKHALELEGTKREFYTLYMHLAPEKLPADGEADARLRYPWLRDLALAPKKGSPEAAAGPNNDMLHLKVAKLGSKGAKVGTKALALGDVLELDPSSADALATWNGTKWKGPAKRVIPNDGATGAFNLSSGTLLQVWDAFPRRFIDEKDALDKGDVVNLWKHKLLVGAGEPLARAGQLGAITTLHFEVLSEAPIPCWVKEDKVVEDADATLLWDRKAFCDRFFKTLGEKVPELKGVREHMVDTKARTDDGMLTPQEVAAFYKDAADAKRFRDLVTKHPSEWSDAIEWDKLAANAKTAYGYLTEPVLKTIQDLIVPYIWWTKDLTKDGLPSSTTVVSYHPIRFLEWVDELRRKEAPGGGDAKLHESVYELNHDPA